MPPSFWWFSVGGTLMLAFYAWATKDPVFILGPTVNLFIYVRNLMLVRDKNKSHPMALIIPLLLVIVVSASRCRLL